MEEGELDAVTRAWLALGVRRREPVAAAPLGRELAGARVAVVSTGGARLPGQEPYHTGRRGDASYRVVPSDTDPGTLVWEHPHYETEMARRDPDCVFPLRLLATLEAEGRIGEVAPSAVSMMGYVPITRGLTDESAPAIGELMQGEAVDAALLCPA